MATLIYPYLSQFASLITHYPVWIRQLKLYVLTLSNSQINKSIAINLMHHWVILMILSLTLSDRKEPKVRSCPIIRSSQYPCVYRYRSIHSTIRAPEHPSLRYQFLYVFSVKTRSWMNSFHQYYKLTITVFVLYSCRFNSQF